MKHILKLLWITTIIPYIVYADEQQCLDIRKRLDSLYDAPNERAIDEARAEIKSKLQPSVNATYVPPCMRTLKELSRSTGKCVKILSTSKIDPNVPLACPADFQDPPMLQYSIRGTVKDNQTFSNILANTERFLDPDRRCQMYQALSKEAPKADLRTVQNLHRSILANLVNPYITEDQNKVLKQAIKNVALKTMMHKIDNEYQPGFMVQLTNVCNLTAANAVRDAIVDIARMDGTIARGGSTRLDEIAQPILELHKHLSPNDLVHPFGMLVGYTTALLKKSPYYDRLEWKLKDKVNKIQEDNSKFYNKLFSDGEFCQNADASSSASEGSWKTDLYIRNKGTFKSPRFSWYNWTETTRGRLMMIGNSDLRMVLPDEFYDFKQTMYQDADRRIGIFREVTPDICSKEFKGAGKMMSLPLDSMMAVHKSKEETGMSYFDILGVQVDGDCPG